MQVEIVGERKKETASILLVGLMLGVCFAAAICVGSVFIAIFFFGIELNFCNTAILSLAAGILLGEAVILKFLK